MRTHLSNMERHRLHCPVPGRAGALCQRQVCHFSRDESTNCKITLKLSFKKNNNNNKITENSSVVDSSSSTFMDLWLDSDSSSDDLDLHWFWCFYCIWILKLEFRTCWTFWRGFMGLRLRCSMVPQLRNCVVSAAFWFRGFRFCTIKTFKTFKKRCRFPHRLIVCMYSILHVKKWQLCYSYPSGLDNDQDIF